MTPTPAGLAWGQFAVRDPFFTHLKQIIDQQIIRGRQNMPRLLFPLWPARVNYIWNNQMETERMFGFRLGRKIYGVGCGGLLHIAFVILMASKVASRYLEQRILGRETFQSHTERLDTSRGFIMLWRWLVKQLNTRPTTNGAPSKSSGFQKPIRFYRTLSQNAALWHFCLLLTDLYWAVG